MIRLNVCSRKITLTLVVILIIRPIPTEMYDTSPSQSDVNYPIAYPQVSDTPYTSGLHPEVTQPESVNRSCGVVPVVNRYKDGKSGRSPYGRHPWQVAILDEYDRFICAGALIQPDYVITTACCVRKLTAKQLRVRLGDWDVYSHSNPEEAYEPFQTHVANIHIHPGSPSYDNDHNYDVYDLALVQLGQAVDFGLYPQISTVCLPESKPYHYHLPEKECWVAGWGKSPVLMRYNTGKYSRILMESLLDKVDKYTCAMQGFNLGYHRIYHGYTCRIGRDGHDVCVADKGSPVVCYLPVAVEQTHSQHTRSYRTADTGSTEQSFRVSPAPQEPAKKKAVLVELVATPSSCSKDQQAAMTVAVSDVVDWINQVVQNPEYNDVYFDYY